MPEHHLIYPGEPFSYVCICSKVYKISYELKMSKVGEKLVQGKRRIVEKFIDLGLECGGEADQIRPCR